MTPLGKLVIEQSTKRERLGALLDIETRSAGETDEMTEITSRLQSIEPELRAATMLEQANTETADTGATGSGEDRDRIELRKAARLTNFVTAALSGRAVSGAEAELSAELGLDAGKIPVELFDVPSEHRSGDIERRNDAAATLPGTTGTNLDTLLPQIYAQSVAPMLGVDMPRVPSGTFATATLTTPITAAAYAKGAAASSNAAAFTAESTTPHRISARLTINLEDIATVGTDSFEPILRQSVALAISDQLDTFLLNDNSGNAPEGLLGDITAPTDPTDTVTWPLFISTVAAAIEGKWAYGLGDISCLVNPETARLAETTFQAGTGAQATPGEMSAASYLREHAAMFATNARMPDTASTIAQAILFRRHSRFLDGVGPMRTAVCPTWAELGIDDIYSDSASGQRHFTLHSLVGDVIVTQPDAYSRTAFKLA